MEMELHILGAYSLRSVRHYAERRLRNSVRRFGRRVKHLKVSIKDVNGPRGGVDKRCRIIAEIRPSGEVVIEETDAQVQEAIDRASSRLRHSVQRKLDRREAHWLGKVKAGSIRYPGHWQLAENEA